MPAKAKPKGRAKRRTRVADAKVATPPNRQKRKSKGAHAKPYDAKKYAGSVPAFASVVAEEMRSWRDDR